LDAQAGFASRNVQPHQAHNSSKVRGKNAPQYLDKGVVLGKKYRIEKMIGGGGFGQIYRATDIVLAAKVEPQSEDAGRMVLEQMVLTKLVGTRHSPKLYASGWLNNYNFIVMQMLGRNLTDLRKAQTERRFSVHTTVRVGIQVVEALKFVHDLGYLHRDVKPSNMCVGIGEHRRIIYLVDFGMTRQFRLPSGDLRKERAYAAFRGTMRYVSLAVHERKEQGPVDDLWSVYYTLIELAEGSLPWRTITEHDEIFQLKRRLTFRDLCRFDLLRSFDSKLSTIMFLKCPSFQRCCKIVDEEADFEWDDENSTQFH
uniref:non-specific serine/threonine protein kinase n=1 Tax=Angiostrongylus costaricensis TaxID=334426 RepID=A0A0R3PLK6_ANGCS